MDAFLKSLAPRVKGTDDTLDRVLKLPSIPQRTPEWYEARKSLITASACADALGCNHYKRDGGRRDLLFEKAHPELGSKFTQNVYTMHGTLFEPIASMLYEEQYSVDIHEAGLIRHPTISYLGASPDGLAVGGRMIEIKCPVTRKIKKQGDVKGVICPLHYWIQIQIQLEVCDLDHCDFWQCRIIEKSCLEEWASWEAPPIPSYAGPRKGVLCVLDDESTVYPPRVFHEEWEWSAWVTSLVDQKKCIKKMVYWCLEDCFNQPVLRDREWFSGTAFPQLSAFWAEVQSQETLTFEGYRL